MFAREEETSRFTLVKLGNIIGAKFSDSQMLRFSLDWKPPLSVEMVPIPGIDDVP